MFSCCSNLLKNSTTNTRTLRHHVQSSRMYSKTPFKIPTMNDLPIPRGSWAKEYAKKNAKNNIVLVVGTGIFGVTLTVATKSGIINWGTGPELKSVLATRDSEDKSVEVEEMAMKSSDVTETELPESPESTIADDSKQNELEATSPPPPPTQPSPEVSTESLLADPAESSPPTTTPADSSPPTPPVEATLPGENTQESELIVKSAEPQQVELFNLPNTILPDFSLEPSAASTAEACASLDSPLNPSFSSAQSYL